MPGIQQLLNIYPSGGYQIANSLRFRSSASAYLTRTESAGNRTTWTWSGWLKRGALGSGLYTPFAFGDNSTGGTDVGAFFRLYNDILYFSEAHSGVDSFNLATTQVFRDPSSWYHFVFSVDTTQATASNRIKIYVNGVQITSFSTATYPSQNFATSANQSGQSARIGVIDVDGAIGQYFDGYMADINFIDGQALTPSSFGQISTITGVWQPIAYSGTYGTNGFKLNFSNGTSTTTLGYDSSGNSNNWTTNNISLTTGSTYDWMIDSPTPFAGTSYGVGNYCVMNPLWKGANITLSDANLSATMANASDCSFMSTFTMTSGKWYWEVLINSVRPDAPYDYPYLGVASPYLNYQATGGSSISTSATGFFKAMNATKFNVTSSAYGSSFAAGDTMMIAYDADNAKLYFGKNGTWEASSNPATGANPAFTGVNTPVTPAGFAYYCSWAMNFGQRPFSYTPPTGYKSLCTYNLPAASIVNGASYMAATTYTGNGSTQSIVNTVNSVSFQPDFVWAKIRNTAGSHNLVDSVRGNTKYLYSDRTDAEGTYSDKLTSFNTNGFSLGSDSTGVGQINTNGNTFVAWQWKANGTAVSNTAGSITSQVSANTISGFSVVTYTGTGANATVGHGLGVAPSMMISKSRSNGILEWNVYHVSLGNTSVMYLNLTLGNTTGQTTYWNSTTPTSSVFSIGTSNNVNQSSGTYVAYCFAAIPGYSAFGSYTGNGSTDGPFVYCGFRPRFIMFKNSSGSWNWVIFDTSRYTYNAMNNALFPNLSDAESSGWSDAFDVLSNGFKLRNSYGSINTNGNTMIYAAFAENPFQNALAR